MPLTIMIPIIEKNVNSRKRSIIKDSKEKEQFIKDVIISIRNLDMTNLSDIPHLGKTVDNFANIVDKSWMKNSKIINVTKHSKSWWDEKCRKDLEKYKRLKSLKDWKFFHSTVKSAKCTFFNLKIQEIVNKKQDPWELMNWVNKHKLSAIKMIKYNGQPYLELDDL